uniref:Uncharacterized protein n=1 Tax=Glossina palpalis gambiensis TaxID=67801 RepID=A0A1B0B4S5_9MUSC
MSEEQTLKLIALQARLEESESVAAYEISNRDGVPRVNPVELWSTATYETRNTFSTSNSSSNNYPHSKSRQLIESPLAAKVDEISVPTCQRAEIPTTEYGGYIKAHENICQAKEITLLDYTGLRFEDNRISATIITAEQRVTVTVDSVEVLTATPEEPWATMEDLNGRVNRTVKTIFAEFTLAMNTAHISKGVNYDYHLVSTIR